VYHGADILLLLLTIAGLTFVLKKTIKQPKNSVVKFLFLFNVFLIMLLIPAVLLNLGNLFYLRILNFLRISYPIFSAIALVYVFRKKKLLPVIFLSILLLATLQFYICQPLVPPASTISKDLPSNEPLVYRAQVNSIYQRRMIGFAEDHVDGRLATDRVTLNQIIGLTQDNFSRNLAWYYPLARLLDENVTKREYDYLLIHLPGKSGAFSEPAEIRTSELIVNTISKSAILYTNGESYICESYYLEE
jgi:hypothetical protein